MTSSTMQGAQEAPVHVRSGECEARWWVGGLAELQLTGAQTGGRVSILIITDPPFSAAPLHVHHDDDETFLILEGSATFEVGGEVFEARPGDVVFGPRGVPHRFTTGPDGLKVVFVMTPAGLEDLVREMSIPAATREVPPPSDEEPDLDEMQRIARAHRCELLLET